jgi:hypothetical protein
MNEFTTVHCTLMRTVHNRSKFNYPHPPVQAHRAIGHAKPHSIWTTGDQRAAGCVMAKEGRRKASARIHINKCSSGYVNSAFSSFPIVFSARPRCVLIVPWQCFARVPVVLLDRQPRKHHTRGVFFATRHQQPDLRITSRAQRPRTGIKVVDPLELQLTPLAVMVVAPIGSPEHAILTTRWP